MKKFLVLVLMIASANFFSACSQNPMSAQKATTQGPAPNDGQGGDPDDGAPDGPVFQVIRSQVLEAQCLRCHSEAGNNRGNVNLETYANVQRWLPMIEDTVSRNAMPPRNVMPEDLKALLLKWIELGAPEN